MFRDESLRTDRVFRVRRVRERGRDTQGHPPRRRGGAARQDRLARTERVRLADDTLVNHAARLYAGYNNSLTERVTLDTGLEYLQSVLVAKRLRLNWVSAVQIQVAGRVGVAVTFTLRYENQPLPNIRPLDTITAVLLTMRFI